MLFFQEQPSRGILIKSCSENMQQIYRRTLQLSWNRTSAWVPSCKFEAYFQNTFSQEHLCLAASLFLIFVISKYTFFVITNTLISYARLKLAKNLAKAKQHPGAELLHFSPTLSSKNSLRYSKKYTKNKCVCFNEVVWLITMKMKNEKNIT